MNGIADKQAKQARRFLKRNQRKLLPALFTALPLSEQKNLTKRYVWAQGVLKKWKPKS
ncbi:hypothetical protein LCGC14_1348150 [marine sediment metagenome]|uniref:Uncharacterized protein n=1 Tax=marine sediment metagenome TaxID=412755 RepID=A0A0F9NE03_9ZZZZ